MFLFLFNFDGKPCEVMKDLICGKVNIIYNHYFFEKCIRLRYFSIAINIYRISAYNGRQ